MHTSDPLLLLLELVSLGARLRVRGEQLLITSARPELVERARRSKSALVALVSQYGGDVPWADGLPGDRNAWTADAREDFEERAAIMEFDGGLDRAEAERLAEASVRLRLTGQADQSARAGGAS
jgi:hypothetical protein